MQKEFQTKKELYKKACAFLGLHLEVVRGDEYLAKISNENSFFLTSFYGFPPLNTSASNNLAKDKVFTKTILADAGLQVPEGDHFFVSGRNEWEPESKMLNEACVYAMKLGYPLFVKPHDQSRARATGLCRNQKDLENKLKEIAEVSHVAIIERIIFGREGRIFCIDGEVQFAYHKIVDSVNGIANPAKGGEIVDFNDGEIVKEYSALGKNVFDAFGGGLRIFAVDFIQVEDTFVILEVNGSPFLSTICEYGYKDTALNIIEETLKIYFDLK